MQVYLGADHAGFKLKEKVKKYLKDSGYKVFDLGAKKLNLKDDYPDYARKAGQKVAEHARLARSSTTELRKGAKLRNLEGGFGILFCGSGHGMCIAANKIKGVRAAAVSNIREAKITREHNNANVLCLSGWQVSFEKAKEIIHTFLNTPFSKEARHRRRVRKIQEIEKS